MAEVDRPDATFPALSLVALGRRALNEGGREAAKAGQDQEEGRTESALVHHDQWLDYLNT